MMSWLLIFTSLLLLWINWSFSRVCFIRIAIYGDTPVSFRIAFNTAHRLPQLVLGLKATKTHFRDWAVRVAVGCGLTAMTYVFIDLLARESIPFNLSGFYWWVAVVTTVLSIGNLVDVLWSLHIDPYKNFVRDADLERDISAVSGKLNQLQTFLGWFTAAAAGVYSFTLTAPSMQFWCVASSCWVVTFLIKAVVIAYRRAKNGDTRISSHS